MTFTETFLVGTTLLLGIAGDLWAAAEGGYLLATVADGAITNNSTQKS